MKAIMSRPCAATLVLLVGVLTHPAVAEERDRAGAAPRSWSEAVEQTTERGAYLPLTLTPSVGTSAALVGSYGGYDSAARAAVFNSFAELRVYGPFALRLGAGMNDSGKEVAPSIGARAQLLTQEKHGLAGAVSLFYKAEGFTEPEGEIESVLSFGRRESSLLWLGNLIYGQDPEGHERDGEIALAALLRLSRFVHLGLDTRGRFDLGSERSKLVAEGLPKYQIDAGPVLNLALGPVAVTARAGASVFRRSQEDATLGVVAIAGLGTAF
jgi:hypothetical protein